MFCCLQLINTLYRYRPTQQQEGGSDCGLFAIALRAQCFLVSDFPTAKKGRERRSPAFGQCCHPSSFKFKQSFEGTSPNAWLSAIRLSHCKKRKREKKCCEMSYHIQVFCSCRMPDHFSEGSSAKLWSLVRVYLLKPKMVLLSLLCQFCTVLILIKFQFFAILL